MWVDKWGFVGYSWQNKDYWSCDMHSRINSIKWQEVCLSDLPLTVVQASDYEGKEILFEISEWHVSHAGVGWSGCEREQMGSFLRHQGYHIFLILRRFSLFLIMHMFFLL